MRIFDLEHSFKNQFGFFICGQVFSLEIFACRQIILLGLIKLNLLKTHFVSIISTHLHLN